MNQSHLEACERVAAIIARTLAPKTHLSADDLRQEAWAAMLPALAAAESSGNVGAYLHTVAMRACRRFTQRASCATTAPRRVVWDAIDSTARSVDVDKATSLSDASPLADSALEAQERTQALSLLLAEHLAAGEEGHAVLAVLAGESKSSEAASEAGIEVTRLYHLTKKAKQSIKADPRFLPFL